MPTALDNADAPENPRAQPGGNFPPVEEQFKDINDALPGYMEAKFGEVFKRAEELIAAAARAPQVIDSEEMAGRMSDFAAQIAACVKEAESLRTGIVAGALQAQRLINTTFDKKVFADLDPDNKKTPGIKQRVLAALTAWERKKAEIEASRRREEERKAREAAEAAERARQEAERKRREAEEAERRAAAEAERRRREAEEAERRRVADEERKAREAAEAEAKAIQNSKDLDEAIAREAQAKVDRAKREEEARAAREKADAERVAREAQERDEAEQRRIKAQAEAKAADDAAAKAAADAAVAEKSASAKAADMHTVRGDLGSSSSLRTTTQGFITNRDDLLKDPQIYPFIQDEALTKAVNAFVKVHKKSKKLGGVDIQDVTGAQVRG